MITNRLKFNALTKITNKKLAIFLSVLIFSNQSFARTVTLSCSVEITTVESQYFPRFGFSGKQRWSDVLVNVLPTTPMPTVIIKNLAILSGPYQTESNTDQEIKFQRVLSHNHKYWGSIDRFTGKLFITEESWPSSTFVVSGYCKAAEKLF